MPYLIEIALVFSNCRAKLWAGCKGLVGLWRAPSTAKGFCAHSVESGSLPQSGSEGSNRGALFRKVTRRLSR